MYQGTCKQCGAAWESRNPQKFCSPSCSYINQKGLHRGGRKPLYEPVTKACLECGASFDCSTVYEVKKKKFCTQSCAMKAVGKKRKAKRVKRPCVICGKVLEVLPCLLETKKYCSYECAAKGKQPEGPGNPSWKGGNSTYWKRKCRERDVGLCRRCGKKAIGKLFHAHHILPIAGGGKNELTNLIGLCNVCHGTVEKEFYDSVISLLPPGTLEKIRDRIQTKYARRKT